MELSRRLRVTVNAAAACLAALIALAPLTACGAKVQPSATAQPPAIAHTPTAAHLPSDITAMIGDTLILNGEKIRLGGPLSDWIRRFGPPSRRLDRAGGMAVWDSLGIVASMRYPFPDSAPHVAALWFTFFHRDVDFWPARPFSGTLAYTQPQPQGGNGAPVTFMLRRGLTRKDIDGLGLSWGSGKDMLADDATLRFTGEKDGDSLEVFFAQIQPTFARLPWEKPQGDR